MLNVYINSRKSKITYPYDLSTRTHVCIHTSGFSFVYSQQPGKYSTGLTGGGQTKRVSDGSFSPSRITIRYGSIYRSIIESTNQRKIDLPASVFLNVNVSSTNLVTDRPFLFVNGTSQRRACNFLRFSFRRLNHHALQAFRPTPHSRKSLGSTFHRVYFDDTCDR